MGDGGSPAAWRRLARVLSLVLLAAAAFIALPIVASASSQPGSITFAPTSGPVGTKVHVLIAVVVSATTTYSLTATETDPQQGGCAQSQPIPGVPPFAVPTPDPSGIGPFQTDIIWPAALDQGPYWLCAAPTSGSGPTAQSPAPFTVTASATASPSPAASVEPTAVITKVVRTGSTPAATPVSSPTEDSMLGPPEGLIVGVVASLLVVAAALLALTAVRRNRTGL